MAENDKKGFSGLGDLAPKKKKRERAEPKNNETPQTTPKQTSQTKYSYPKDDPYALPSFSKITKNQWIVIGIGILILWVIFSDDNSSNSSSSNNKYSQHDIAATPDPNTNNNFHGYGAVYFDTESQVFGWALGHQTAYEAESAALLKCIERGPVGTCEKGYSGRAQCISVATGDRDRAYAVNSTKEGAESAAITSCQEQGESCEIPPEGSACSE
jgi:hypothetical protein